MNTEQFDKLARTDRVVLLSALTLLWQNGRREIQAKDVSALTEDCMSSLGTLYTKEKLHEIAMLCKELAVLDTAELIRCIRCDSMEVEGPNADVEGICPICGSELVYGDDESLDDGGVYEWTCPNCGATGKEGYDKVFDKHCNVRDGEGNLYPATPSDSKRSAAPETMEGPLFPGAVEELVMDGGRIDTLCSADVAGLSTCFPKDDWEEYLWGFTCFSRQEYAGTVLEDSLDEIMLGIQSVRGGCLCEMAIRWYMINGTPTPRLEMYDEAWPLFQAPTFVSALGQLTQMCKDHSPTSDEVSAMLIALGFTDQSDRPLDTTQDRYTRGDPSVQ